MQSSISSDDRDEFKLSFKPMTQNNGSANFMNQSSSILMTGYHDNASANSNSLLQQNPTPSNLSMFHPVSNQSMNLNTTSVTDTLPHNQSTNSHNLNASNLSFNPMKTVVESNNTHSANMLNSSLRHLPTDSEVIFYESVPIVVRSSAVESNTRNLTLKIEKVVQLPQNQQILSITLTYEVRFAIFPYIPLYFLVMFPDFAVIPNHKSTRCGYSQNHQMNKSTNNKMSVFWCFLFAVRPVLPVPTECERERFPSIKIGPDAVGRFRGIPQIIGDVVTAMSSMQKSRTSQVCRGIGLFLE